MDTAEIIPTILEDLELEESKLEVTTLGLKWNLVKDTIIPNVYVDINGKKTEQLRGAFLHQDVELKLNESMLNKYLILSRFLWC